MHIDTSKHDTAGIRLYDVWTIFLFERALEQMEAEGK